MTREERLVDAARYALRFLSGKTYGQQDRICAGRQLHDALIDHYDDLEPTHVQDREEWRARQAAKVGAADWVATLKAAQAHEAASPTNAVDPSVADPGTPTPRDAVTILTRAEGRV